MGAFDMAKAGRPFTFTNKPLGLVFPVGKGRTQGQLPVVSKRLQAVFGTRALIAHPAKVIMKMGFHVIGIVTQRGFHPQDDLTGRFGLFDGCHATTILSPVAVSNRWQMLAGTLANLFSMFLVGLIEKWFGKKFGFALGVLGTLIFTVAFYFVPDTNVGLLLLVHILINVVSGPNAALIWAMYTDSADYSEWKTGRRATGLVMSACTMAQKFGYTLGGALGMAVLAYIGYQANTDQTPQALAGIKGMVSWISAIPCAIGVVLIMFYPLSTQRLKTIETDLKTRRTNGESDED